MTLSSRSLALLMVSLVAAWSCDSPTTPVSPDPRMSPAHVATSLGVSDGSDKVWRQLVETTGLSWTQVAEACPRDGATPCGRPGNGPDLRGWIWGTSDQVTALLALYEPGILTTPTVEGFAQFFTAENFFASFRPTFAFALTYQAGQHAAGWTSSTDADGAPIAASVGNGHNSVSISGSFSIAAVADPNEMSGSRGVFLWHAAGLGVVDAVNDAGSTNPDGGTAVANVLANDTFAGAAANLTTLVLTQLSGDADVKLDPADGSIRVTPGAAVGVKQLEYSLCEIASPTNCDIAAATVTVVPYTIDAIDDAGGAVSTMNATSVVNVLANDRFNGSPASAENVVLSFVSSTNGGVTLDASNGSVDVAAGTPGGVQTLIYRICEAANPSNCAQATVKVDVVPQTIVVSASRITVKEGGAGSFTVRLSQRPATDVVVPIAFYQGTGVVTPNPSSLTFTAENWAVPVAVTFQTSSDADRINNAATINVSSSGIATVPVVVRIMDGDQSTQSPTAILEAPLNGQTVAGVVEFSGTGTDSNGQVVEARFSVDNNSVFKDRRTATTFRMSGGWNTHSVPNGWHTLELRVIDNSGNDGRMTIKVFVNN